MSDYPLSMEHFQSSPNYFSKLKVAKGNLVSFPYLSSSEQALKAGDLDIVIAWIFCLFICISKGSSNYSLMLGGQCMKRINMTAFCEHNLNNILRKRKHRKDLWKTLEKEEFY